MRFKAYLKSDMKIRTGLFEAVNSGAALWVGAGMLGVAEHEIMLVEERALTCPKCGYTWKFSGFRKIYATCAQCMRQIKIPKL